MSHFYGRSIVGALLALLATGAHADSALVTAPTLIIVVDGDTLKVGEQSVRLFGIDAPEMTQPGGKESRRRLLSLVAMSGWVTCRFKSRDRYRRLVGKCYDVHGNDFARTLVREGLAFAYVDYSDEYASDEAYASAYSLGLHAGKFEYPWVYRRRRK